ncbi:MAG: L-threonine 3-dehydrogenase [Bacillota bacterium]
MGKILVTGAYGQIGSELTHALRSKYGTDMVIASDLKKKLSAGNDEGLAIPLDCCDFSSLEEIVKKYGIDTIFHLASILSASAEEKPQFAWNVNMGCLYNVLEIAREYKCRVFTPSSIACFGPSTPINNVPQITIQRPTTIYGITKVAGELLCDYYFRKFHVDTRGVRYPGLISYKTPPGGGTTDYAVEIYYEAILNKKYTCYLEEGTFLDMMYMPDAIKAAIDLMEADSDRLINRNAFNITAMSIAPENIAAEIRKHIPEFSIDYKVDPLKQSIADSWPNSLDDSAAKEEWDWKPEFDLATMTVEMLEKLTEKLKSGVSVHQKP